MDVRETYTLKDIMFLVLGEYSPEMADQFNEAFHLQYPMNDGMLETEVKKMQAFLITFHRLLGKLEKEKPNREYIQQGVVKK